MFSINQLIFIAHHYRIGWVSQTWVTSVDCLNDSFYTPYLLLTTRPTVSELWRHFLYLNGVKIDCRSVHEEEKAFALGVQFVMLRLFGKCRSTATAWTRLNMNIKHECSTWIFSIVLCDWLLNRNILGMLFCLLPSQEAIFGTSWFCCSKIGQSEISKEWLCTWWLKNKDTFLLLTSLKRQSVLLDCCQQKKTVELSSLFIYNPVDSKGSYSATSNNTKLIHWLFMGSTAAPPSPLLTVPNVTAHPSTANLPITIAIWWSVAVQF